MILIVPVPTDWELIYGACRILDAPRDVALMVANRAAGENPNPDDDETIAIRVNDWAKQDRESAYARIARLIKETKIKIMDLGGGKRAIIHIKESNDSEVMGHICLGPVRRKEEHE